MLNLSQNFSILKLLEKCHTTHATVCLKPCFRGKFQTLPVVYSGVGSCQLCCPNAMSAEGTGADLHSWK